jgi:hypothetical protein
MGVWETGVSLKASIALKIFFLNENASELYSKYLHTEMLVIRPHLSNYADIFLDWVNSIQTKWENYNEGGSGSVVLFIESLNVNICRFKKDFILRGGGAGERAIVIKYHSDLEGCKGIQRIFFDTRLQCFKYAFLIAAYRPLQKDASKKKLDELTVNGREGAKFPIVDFNCLNGQFPVTLKGIDIFERANAHLKIGVTVLQYETEFGEGHRSDKKGVLFPVRAPSIESVEHWVWLLYTPTAEPDSIGHFNTITDISRVLGEGKNWNVRYYCPTCLSRFWTDLKLKNHMKHCKRHEYQAVETVSGD